MYSGQVLDLQIDKDLANSKLCPSVLAAVCLRKASRTAFYRKRHALVCTDIFEDLEVLIADMTKDPPSGAPESNSLTSDGTSTTNR